MRTISNTVFDHETVCMDEKHFEDCVLQDCVLEYSGKELTIARTEFRGCRLNLTEHAGRTLLFLRCMGYMEDVAGDWAPRSGDASNQREADTRPN